MLGKIGHRGPDGKGLKNMPGIGTLGHTRLAIIDPEGGQQPMCSPDGAEPAWISFNGEIYNFHELATEHLANEALLTRSDTEVVLKLYGKLGPRCVELLDGMFAFALIQGDELFMARDPLGIKPLYYGERDGIFYFSSEIKSMALVVDAIREFPAGHWYHSTRGWHAYYLMQPAPLDLAHEDEALQAIRATTEAAVQKRLLSDAPVGISLSGGLDSSIVALHACAAAGELHSFAVGMEGGEDVEAARKVASILGTRHHERIYTEAEILEALPRVIYHLESCDPALVRSAIPNYFLAEMASRYVKVILTGEGADELYAGYEYLRADENPKLLQKEMMGITAALHNTNLQRADRIAMAFGLEARAPFLDMESVALALGLPAQWKIQHERPAKFLLRRAYRGDLPEEIANRQKQKFSQGAGSSDVIARKAEAEIANQDFYSERARLHYQWGYRLPNKEALYYYRVLSEHYQDQWIFPSMGTSRSL